MTGPEWVPVVGGVMSIMVGIMFMGGGSDGATGFEHRMSGESTFSCLITGLFMREKESWGVLVDSEEANVEACSDFGMMGGVLDFSSTVPSWLVPCAPHAVVGSDCEWTG